MAEGPERDGDEVLPGQGSASNENLEDHHPAVTEPRRDFFRNCVGELRFAPRAERGGALDGDLGGRR